MDHFYHQSAGHFMAHMDDDILPNIPPISNLPTPPPTLASKSAGEGTSYFPEVDPKLMAPAAFLTRLIPTNAARQAPSPALIATYLARARLPTSTIALSACILDSLSSFFARLWQRELVSMRQQKQQQRPPQHPGGGGPQPAPQRWSASFVSSGAPIPATITPPSSQDSSTPSSEHNSPPASLRRAPSRPRSYTTWFAAPPRRPREPLAPRAELIVLGALHIATGFLDDARVATGWWARRVAEGGVDVRELDATVRCILRDIDYDLLAFGEDGVTRMEGLMFAVESEGVEE